MTGHEVGAALGLEVLWAVATAAGGPTAPAGVVAGFSAAFLAAAGLAVLLGTIAYLGCRPPGRTAPQPCTGTTRRDACRLTRGSSRV